MSEKNTITSRCPVKTERTHVMQRLSTMENVIFHSFEKDFLWLYQSESQYNLWYKNHLIQEGPNFSDYYGFLNSIDCAIEAAQECAQTLEIDIADNLQIKITTSLSKTPVLLDESYEARVWNNAESNIKAYIPFPDKTDHLFYFDEDQKNLYLELVNHQDVEERWNAWERIENLQINSKILAQNFLIGSSIDGYKKNYEEFMSIVEKDLAI